MGKKLYVGNLAYSATEESLNTLFSQHGTVDSCQLITDRETGRSKGFGFVEMSSDEEAQAAISGLDGRDVDGRPLRVSEARPKSGGFSGRSESRGSFSSQNEGFGEHKSRRFSY